MRIELGPYDLVEPVGRGGMATVWRGELRNERLPVAVKVLDAQHLRDPGFRAWFASEVRVMASLDHPHIARIYDQGVVQASSDRRLPLGAPYMVMEWASGGRLELGRIGSWAPLRSLLIDLLDALAHAHARGVVHRDLKPSNITVCTEADPRPGIKLVDFGVAHVVEHEALELDDSGEQQLFGTPRFMAPEQVMRDFRALGPWTDLYALGCLAFAAANGNTPFRGAMEQVIAAQVEAPVPELRPRFEVPDGFEPWLRRLLDKRPERRFRRAADAAFALSVLDPPAPGREASARHIDDGTTLTMLGLESEQVPTAILPQEHERASLPPVSFLEAAQPPVPVSWRGGEPPQVPTLTRIGLELHGLRSLPLVDRSDERDRMWSQLREVAGDGKPRVLEVRGATGTGKSRLGEWLCQRAHELGAATPLRVVHGPTLAASHGLPSSLARHYRVAGLGRDEMARRLASRFATVEGRRRAEALAWLASGEPSDHVVFTNATERFALLRDLLEEIAAERPVVVTVDDAAHGADTLSFLRHALERWRVGSMRVLFVLVSSPSDQTTGLVEGVLRLELGPLGPADHTRLLHEQLGLEGELASSVAARTAGNPLFAVQLVRDWIARGLLVPSESGLRHVQTPALPYAVDDVWRARAEQVRERSTDDEWLALELGAALGRHVDAAEWAEACALAQVAFPSARLDALLSDQLLRTDDHETWQFAHEPVREAFERTARAAGRWADHQRLCAEMLEGRPGPDAALRRARHLVAAGAERASLDPFVQAARGFLLQGDNVIVHSVLDEHERALAKADLAAHDERRAAGRVVRAQVMAREGRFAEAEPATVALEREARRHGWVKTQLAMMVRLVQQYRNKGDFAAAASVALEAQDLANHAGERALRADVLAAYGDLHVRAGNNDEAVVIYLRAIDDYRLLNREFDIARIETGLGAVARARGRSEEAIVHLQTSLDRFARCGSRWGVAKAANALADCLRDRGDLEGAERMYREALGHLDALGAQEARFVEANLGILSLQLGRTDEARDILERCDANLRRLGGESALITVIHLGALALAGQERDFVRWDEAIVRARQELAVGRLVDPDLPLLLTLAAEAAEAAGDAVRARAAHALAANEWNKLGRAHEAAVSAARASPLG